MKRLYKLVSIVCVIAAGLLEAFGIFAIFTSEEPLWRGLALFNLATRGTTAGFIFSIVGVLLSTLAYSTLWYYGLLKYRDAGEQKCALIWCICTVAFTFLSLLLAACNGTTAPLHLLMYYCLHYPLVTLCCCGKRELCVNNLCFVTNSLKLSA